MKSGNRILTSFQKFGKVLMAPVLLLPIAGILVGIGSAFSNPNLVKTMPLLGSPFLAALFKLTKDLGNVINNNIPIIFAMSIAYGFAKKEKATAAISGFIAYMGMNTILGSFLILNGTIHPEKLLTGQKMILGITTLDTGVFGGILIGLIVSALHNRYYKIELPAVLSIFNGTVKDNVELNADANQEYEKMSFFDKFVGKENLKLTSDGTNLSGGDKQKIVLGRLIANCKDVDVIILDEVTSSMDTDTETKAFDEILPLLKNKIVLIISHNKNLQRYANRIVKLKDKTIMLENN